jgi:hypothetical protein
VVPESEGSGLEGITTDPEGVAAGGVPLGSPGTAPSGKGSAGSKGSGGQSASETGGKGIGGSGPASPDNSSVAPTWPVIVVPDAIRETTSPYEGEIFVEVDFYVLYSDYMSAGINVPGHEICLEGNRLRTIHPVAFQQTKTDNSKCYPLPYGEPERIHCPPDAHTVITTRTFLTSPVKYSINVCLAYDKSNCDWRDPGDGPEKEVCTPGSEYKGMWAAGTLFHYRCTKYDAQHYEHPLRYGVRFVRDIEFPEERPRRRVVQSETRQIAACK